VRIFQRGGSDGTDTRMYEATGETLLIQKRNLLKRVGHITKREID
jgi:hypothetical protein